jgi:hypothetical protein
LKIYKAVAYNYKFLTFGKDIKIILKEKATPLSVAFSLPGNLPAMYYCS